MVIVLFFMFGCREYHYYRYKNAHDEAFGGRVTVSIEGTYGENYEKDGKKMADWSFPYRLQFYLVAPAGLGIQRMEVVDVSIKGQDSGNAHQLSGASTVKVKTDANSGETNAFVSIGGIAKDDYEYEDYIVDARVRIFLGETKCEEKEVRVLLEADYRKGSGSDWLDEKMSP